MRWYVNVKHGDEGIVRTFVVQGRTIQDAIKAAETEAQSLWRVAKSHLRTVEAATWPVREEVTEP